MPGPDHSVMPGPDHSVMPGPDRASLSLLYVKKNGPAAICPPFEVRMVVLFWRRQKSRFSVLDSIT